MNAFVLDAILPVALVVCTLWNGLGFPMALLGWFLIRKEIDLRAHFVGATVGLAIAATSLLSVWSVFERTQGEIQLAAQLLHFASNPYHILLVLWPTLALGVFQLFYGVALGVTGTWMHETGRTLLLWIVIATAVAATFPSVAALFLEGGTR